MLSAPSAESLGTRLLLAADRWRYPMFAIWISGLSMLLWTRWNDWNYLAAGGDLLFGQQHRVWFTPDLYFLGPTPGGVHLFANYPFLQTGPLSLVVAGGLRVVGPAQGLVAAIVISGLLGLLSFRLIELTAVARNQPIDPRIRFLSGMLVLSAW